MEVLLYIIAAVFMVYTVATNIRLRNKIYVVTNKSEWLERECRAIQDGWNSYYMSISNRLDDANKRMKIMHEDAGKLTARVHALEDSFLESEKNINAEFSTVWSFVNGERPSHVYLPMHLHVLTPISLRTKVNDLYSNFETLLKHLKLNIVEKQATKVIEKAKR